MTSDPSALRTGVSMPSNLLQQRRILTDGLNSLLRDALGIGLVQPRSAEGELLLIEIGVRDIGVLADGVVIWVGGRHRFVIAFR